jgi:hypothetical protein
MGFEGGSTSYPSISESRFQSYDWTDFYKYAGEPIPSNMPTPRGRVMSTHCFVDSDHAGESAGECPNNVEPLPVPAPDARE